MTDLPTSPFGFITRRIRDKILFSVVGVLLALSGVALAYIYHRIEQDLLESAVEEAESTAQIFSLTLWRGYQIPDDISEIQRYIYRAGEYKPNLLEINVIDRSLSTISSTNDARLETRAVGEAYGKALAYFGAKLPPISVQSYH